MKNTEARKVLGLDPGDDPRAFLPAFEETIDFKKELVKNAPNAEIKSRYEQELIEYEAAVRAVASQQKSRPNTDFIVVLLLLAALAAVGLWGYQWYQQQWNEHTEAEVKISDLEMQARAAVIARKWQEAEQAYQKIEELDPGSTVVANGRQAIKRGKQAELSQQLFYTLGESQAALEAGRWHEAEKLARKVLTIDPENEAAKRKLEIIAEGKRKQETALKMLAVTEALDHKDVQAARRALEVLRKQDPQNPNIPEYESRITIEENKVKQRQNKALTLLAKAKELDTGEYSSEAMSLLDEARRLFPTHQGILSQHQKMGAYTSTIKVPVDFPSITQALENARPNDLIRVAAGTYKEALVINKPVRLEGAAENKTVIELAGKSASLLTLTADADGASVAGIVFRHTGFDHGKDRYAAITVMAKNTAVRSCIIEHAAGHGIAVVEGGSAEITGCSITLCGWDGISVYGQGSMATVADSRCEKNLQNGVHFWKGGHGSITNSHLLNNGLSGVVAMGQEAQVTLKSNTCSANREAGILVTDAAHARVELNKCEKNLLSGIVARSKDTRIAMVNNLTRYNQEAGILIHKAVTVEKFDNNRASGNGSRQIWRDADLK